MTPVILRGRVSAIRAYSDRWRVSEPRYVTATVQLVDSFGRGTDIEFVVPFGEAPEFGVELEVIVRQVLPPLDLES